MHDFLFLKDSRPFTRNVVFIITNIMTGSFKCKREDFVYVAAFLDYKPDGLEEKDFKDLHLEDLVASSHNMAGRDSKHLQKLSRRA
jgi:hypothetical protein